MTTCGRVTLGGSGATRESLELVASNGLSRRRRYECDQDQQRWERWPLHGTLPYVVVSNIRHYEALQKAYDSLTAVLQGTQKVVPM